MNDGHTRSLNVKTWNQCKANPLPPIYTLTQSDQTRVTLSTNKGEGKCEIWMGGYCYQSLNHLKQEIGKNWKVLGNLWFGKFVIWEKIIIGFDSIPFTSLTGGKLRTEILIYFKFLGWHLGNIQIYVSTSEMLPFHNENEKYWNQVLEMYEK